MRHPLVLAGLSFALVAIAAGCGNGGGRGLTPTTTQSSTAPSSTSAAIRTTSSSSATVGAGSITAQVTIPQAQSGSGTVTINASTSVLGTTTVFTASRHVAVTGPSSGTPLLYLELQPSASFTVTSYPSFSVTLPSSDSTTGENFYVAFYSNDPTYGSNGAWDAPIIGPATVSGQTLSFTGGSTPNAVTLSSSYYYVFCLYEASSSPSPSSSPSTSPSSSSSPPPAYTFAGSTASVTYTAGQTPTAASLTAYHGITVTATFVAPTSGNGTINYSDAINNGDITPSGFVADNATTGYTPIVYLSADNVGTQDISFGANVPTIQLGDLSLTSYTSCNFDVYGSNGNNTYSWFTAPNAGTPSGSGVTVGGGTLPAGNTVDFKAGSQQIIAVSCH
jgi:hypothetical protein